MTPHPCEIHSDAPLPVKDSGARLRVLVVDDSVVIRRMVSKMLDSDAAIEVVGSAKNGAEALSKTAQLDPDVVTLDIEMPELDGVGALRLLRSRHPKVKVIMLSSLTERGAAITIEALMMGANDYVTKPYRMDAAAGSPLEALGAELIFKIKQLYGLKDRSATPALGLSSVTQGEKTIATGLAPHALVIGVSTGGPSALTEILPLFPSSFPLPIAIVQHMPPTFTQLLANRLAKLSAIEVVEGQEGMTMQPGRAIIAPGDFHMRMVRQIGGIGRVAVALDREQQENSCRPAVDALFRSAAGVYGGRTLALVLTGMGQDGLKGVRALKELGASVLVQDKDSSVVWGMPGAVVEANLADRVIALKEMVPEILRRVRCH